jgi:hypothetical protein
MTTDLYPYQAMMNDGKLFRRVVLGALKPRSCRSKPELFDLEGGHLMEARTPRPFTADVRKAACTHNFCVANIMLKQSTLLYKVYADISG